MLYPVGWSPLAQPQWSQHAPFAARPTSRAWSNYDSHCGLTRFSIRPLAHARSSCCELCAGSGHQSFRGTRPPSRAQRQQVFRAIVALPLMVAPVVGALAWRFIFVDGYGMIDSIAASFGASGPLWFSDIWLARATIVIANLWMALPFDILVLLAGLASLPTDPIEAAQVDGASPTQCFHDHPRTLRMKRPHGSHDVASLVTHNSPAQYVSRMPHQRANKCGRCSLPLCLPPPVSTCAHAIWDRTRPG